MRNNEENEQNEPENGEFVSNELSNEPTINLAFATNLTKLMGDKNFSNADLAKKIGVSPTSVLRYTKGEVPKGMYLMRIADFFDCSIDWLLGRVFERPVKQTAGESADKSKIDYIYNRVEQLEKMISMSAEHEDRRYKELEMKIKLMELKEENAKLKAALAEKERDFGLGERLAGGM